MYLTTFPLFLQRELAVGYHSVDLWPTLYHFSVPSEERPLFPLPDGETKAHSSAICSWSLGEPEGKEA